MNNIISKIGRLLLCLSLLTGCGGNDQPEIDSVWLNVSSAPAVEVACAYPGQVLCLRGHNLSGVSALYVNGCEVNIDGSYIYATDVTYTFTVPTDVKVSEDYDLCDIRLLTADGEALFSPFIINAKSDKPSVSKVSATELKPGASLVITGKNLKGVEEVWLPTVFDGRVECEIDSRVEPTPTSVTVIVPDGVTFTTGWVELVLRKCEYASNASGRYYIERVYSDKYGFKNSDSK